MNNVKILLLALVTIAIIVVELGPEMHRWATGHEAVSSWFLILTHKEKIIYAVGLILGILFGTLVQKIK